MLPSQAYFFPQDKEAQQGSRNTSRLWEYACLPLKLCALINIVHLDFLTEAFHRHKELKSLNIKYRAVHTWQMWFPSLPMLWLLQYHELTSGLAVGYNLLSYNIFRVLLLPVLLNLLFLFFSSLLASDAPVLFTSFGEVS